MPYAPGIQDISGQLIAQGMSQAGAARARAIESLGESISGGIKQYQQNQMFTQQALGKFGQQLQDPTFKQYVDRVVNDDPNAPQVPDALKKAFKNAAAGKVDIYDAALLGTATEGYQQNKMRSAQTALVEAQARQLNTELRQRAAVAAMLGLPVGDMELGAAPQMAQPIQPAVAPAAAPVASAPAAPIVAPKAVAEFMGQPPSQGAVPSAPSSLASFDPEIADAARRESALKFLTTGQYADPTVVAQRIATERRKQSAEERQLTLEEAKAQQEAFNESQMGLPPGQRRAATVKESGTGGHYVLNIGLAELTPMEKKQLEAETKQEEFRLGRINDRIKSDIATAQADRLIAPSVANLERIIKEGTLDEGAFAALKANIMSFGKALNFPIDERKLSDTQQALAYFGQIVLPTFAFTKGGISDKETELFRSWNPQLGLSNDANLALLGVLQKRITLNREIETLANRVDAEEISIKDYMKSRNELIKAYDKSIPSATELRELSGVRDKPIAQGLGIGSGEEPAPAAQPVTNASSMFNTLMEQAKKKQTP
jgi:hypothetical protein